MNTALIFCHCVLGVDVTVAAGLVEVIEVKHACALPLFFIFVSDASALDAASE